MSNKKIEDISEIINKMNQMLDFENINILDMIGTIEENLEIIINLYDDNKNETKNIILYNENSQKFFIFLKQYLKKLNQSIEESRKSTEEGIIIFKQGLALIELSEKENKDIIKENQMKEQLIKEKDDKIKKLINENKEKNNAINDFIEQFDFFEKEMNKDEKTIKEQEKKINEYEKTIQKLKDDIHKLEEDNIKQKNIIIELEKNYELKKSEIKDLEKDIKELENSFQEQINTLKNYSKDKFKKILLKIKK